MCFIFRGRSSEATSFICFEGFARIPNQIFWSLPFNLLLLPEFLFYCCYHYYYYETVTVIAFYYYCYHYTSLTITIGTIKTIMRLSLIRRRATSDEASAMHLCCLVCYHLNCLEGVVYGIISGTKASRRWLMQCCFVGSLMPGRSIVLCKMVCCVCYRLIFLYFLAQGSFCFLCSCQVLGHGASVLRTRSVEKHVAKRITGLRKAGWAQPASAVESQGSTGCAPVRLQSAAIAMTLGPLFGRPYFR